MRDCREVRGIPPGVRRELTSICTKEEERRTVKHPGYGTKEEGAGREGVGHGKDLKSWRISNRGVAAERAWLEGQSQRETVKKEIEDPRIVGEERDFQGFPPITRPGFRGEGPWYGDLGSFSTATRRQGL